MNKPMGYDEVIASGEFVPVSPGGHYCDIKKVEETQSSTGKSMIVVYFDFNQQDVQAGYFMQQYNDDTREEKSWPFAGRKYVMVEDYNDASKVSRQFKTFCSCVEESNENFTVQWGDDWGAQFTNKKIGIVFGREEQEYNGKVSMRSLPRYFCRIAAVANAKVPEDKLLPKKEIKFEPLDPKEMPF